MPGAGFVSVKLVDKDKGFNRLMSNAAKAKQGMVKVGILAAEGAETANNNPALTVFDVATFNAPYLSYKVRRQRRKP